MLNSCNSKEIILLEEPGRLNDVNYFKHFAYSFSYNEKTEQSNWVAYELNIEMLNSNFERANRFKIDTSVISGTSNDLDYKGSGYDRGHLVPARDMTWDEKAIQESFFYSNVSPQLPTFNRGKWKQLESLVRKLVFEYENLYVVCGPLFNNTNKCIGENNVVIPTHFFKTLLVYNDDYQQSIGFIFPHQKCDGNLSNYVISIDSVEKITRLDFYHKLPNYIEELIESKIDTSFWMLN